MDSKVNYLQLSSLTGNSKTKINQSRVVRVVAKTLTGLNIKCEPEPPLPQPSLTGLGDTRPGTKERFAVTSKRKRGGAVSGGYL